MSTFSFPDVDMSYGDHSSYPALGFNPAPGNSGTVGSLAQRFLTVSGHLGQAREAILKAGQSGGFWQGDAAQAFHDDIGKLPDYLSKATQSMGDAGKALDGWVTDLSSLQRTAADFERQAEQAQRAVNEAQQNPDLNLAGQQFDTDEALRAAQQRLDSATAQLHRAEGELNAIREQAKRLYGQHQDLVAQVEDALKRAKDEAPDEPGLFDRIGDALGGLVHGIEDVAKKTWNFVQDHADLIAKISDVIADVSAVIGVVGLCLDEVPPVGEILGAVSAGLSGVALVGHVTAKAAGADVSWETIALDGVGVATLGIGRAVATGGKLVKAGTEAVEAATKGANIGTALGSIGGPIVQKYVFGDDDAPNLVDDFKNYWMPHSPEEAIADVAIPGFPLIAAGYHAADAASNG